MSAYTDSPTKRRWPLALLALVALASLAALFVSLGIEHGRPLALPQPTGSFAVGRVVYDWVDNTTVDPLAPLPATKRELLVWIWYPATPTSATAPAPYLPRGMRPPSQRGIASHLFSLLTRDLSEVRCHSLLNAAVSPRESSYPVAIMRAGASSPVVNYSTIAEDLASHGYVVVGLDAPYRTQYVSFPEGRTIERLPANNPELFSGDDLTRLANKLMAAWTGDIGFVLDRLQQLNASDPSGRFAGRLDMSRIGVFGHSFGGAQAAQFCSVDSRCKAGIDIDGALVGSVIRNGLHKPFLFLLSGNGDFSTAAEVRHIKADIDSVYDRLPAAERLRIVIRGANHFTFSDDGALLKSGMLRGLFHIFGVLGIDGRRQLAVTAYCVHGFFDAFLKHQDASPPRIASASYPELQVQ